MDANKTGIDTWAAHLAIDRAARGGDGAAARVGLRPALRLGDVPAAAAGGRVLTLHPADATAEVPWAWPAEALFSADTDAGDVLFVPDGWSVSNMFNVEAVTLAAEVETGVGEFSVALK